MKNFDNELQSIKANCDEIRRNISNNLQDEKYQGNFNESQISLLKELDILIKSIENKKVEYNNKYNDYVDAQHKKDVSANKIFSLLIDREKVKFNINLNILKLKKKFCKNVQIEEQNNIDDIEGFNFDVVQNYDFYNSFIKIKDKSNKLILTINELIRKGLRSIQSRQVAPKKNIDLYNINTIIMCLFLEKDIFQEYIQDLDVIINVNGL
jgi:hypothetical protein